MATHALCVLRLTYCRTQFLRISLYSSLAEHAKPKVGKVVNVAIVGTPNSGKSTLINNIMERKICAASNKVHTTTKLLRAMCFEKDTQIIFLDTPGIVTNQEQKKYNLPDSMIGACHKSLRCADVIGVVHDISNLYTKDCLNPDLIQMLNSVEDIPSFLIINKVDKLKNKKQLLTTIRNLTNGSIAGNPIPGSKYTKKPLDKKTLDKKQERGFSKFSDVFLVSALNGDGVKDIKEYLISNAKAANYQYSPSQFTDQTPENLIVEAVRAKFLDFLPQEIPYKLKTHLEYYEEIEELDKILCAVIVQCPSERLYKLIVGAGGGRLEQIRSQVRNDLVGLFKKIVVLDLKMTVTGKTAE